MSMEREAFMPFEKLKIKGCDRIFSISAHGLGHFKKIFPDFKEKFSVARLAVINRNKRNNIIQKEFFRIVTCSGVTPNKRIFRLPEILSHLKSIPIEWVHFGVAKEGNMKILQQQIDKYDLAKMCNLKGLTKNEDVISYYEREQVNLFLNLSIAEGIPVSIMEAFSFGIPAIATDTVGNPEIVNITNGFVIPIDFNAKDVAAHILKMYHDFAFQLELREGAFIKFDAEYNASKNYQKFAEDLFNS